VQDQAIECRSVSRDTGDEDHTIRTTDPLRLRQGIEAVGEFDEVIERAE
jgi:hypothetical protein